MPFWCAAEVLKYSYNIFTEVRERLEALSESDDYRVRIERRIKELQTVVEELKASGVDEFPASSQECLRSYEEALGSCKTNCDAISTISQLGKFFKVNAYKAKLHALDKDLERARDSLQLALTRTLVAQNQDLQRQVEEGTSRVEAAVAHPSVGLYRGTSVTSKISKPLRIESPEVRLVNDLMVVKWVDKLNTSLEVERYEVRYDDEREAVVPGTPDELRNESNGAVFSLSLGCPKIRLGQVYTVQVRAVNRQGPGEWSKETVTRFKIGPPNKPRRPSLTVVSPTEVQVQVQRLKEKDENGGAVQECLVEYVCTEDTNASEWQILRCPIKNRRDSDVIKFAVKRLTPDSTYSFRVKMINEAGESPPSGSDQAITTQLTPGRPQDLRVSSKRTDKMIKLRWRPPKVNFHIVYSYEVQIRKLSPEAPWNTIAVVKAEKLSATARELESHTKYEVKVRATNNKNEDGEFTDAIQVETCFGIGGHIAGKVAESIAASRAGGQEGGLLETLAASLKGVVSGVAAYKAMAGELNDLSPQSSEDEGADESTF